MELGRAFGVKRKEVVAFVGGGGKTTAMFRLASELAAQGKRVVSTTTTRIFASQIRLAPQVVHVESNEQALADTRALLQQFPHVLVIGAGDADGKAFGVAPELVDALIALDEVDAVIVEADGSRMRPFKAPNDTEPVIPHSTTLVVPVVGIDVLGAPLGEERVHRPELVAQLLGVPGGTVLTPQHIATVLASPRGGLKNRPANARVIPLLNKVEDAAQARAAKEIADLLLRQDEIEAVAIGAVQNSAAPVSALVTRVAAIILAAGGSKRMQNSLKQLLPWGDATLIENAVKVAAASGVHEIVVVTGSQAEAVEERILNGHLPHENAKRIHAARNGDWATGRASSIRVGIRALDRKSAAAIFINADQPFLTPEVIDRILDAYATTQARIVEPHYNGKSGSPVLIGRELFGEMTALDGEQGGRDLMDKYAGEVVGVEIANARAAVDVDTPEEYRAAQQAK